MRRAIATIVAAALFATEVPAQRRSAGRVAQRAVLVVSGTALIASATFVIRFVPFVRSAPRSSPESLAEAQRADLAYLRTLPRYDRAFSEDGRRVRFERFIDSVVAIGGERTPAEFELLVARAVAIAENGHSSVGAAARRQRLGDALPVRFGRFAEGLFITAAADGYEPLLHAQVLAIGDVPAPALYDSLAVHHGGPPQRAHYYAPLDLASPALLHALGAGAAPDTAVFTMRLATGVDSVAQLVASTPPSPPTAPPRFAMSQTPDGRGFSIRIDANENSRDVKVKAFAKLAVDSVRHLAPAYVVVDLRRNGGGTTTLRGFTHDLATVLPADGHLYVIVSAGTFSYGMATAALLKRYGGDRTVLVGEPVGDRLRFWANGGTTFQLRHSGITLRAWSGLEDFGDGCRSWRQCFWLSPFFRGEGVGTLDIDVPAPPSFADYLAGRDTAVEAILRREDGGTSS